jgi:hypothetical protein
VLAVLPGAIDQERRKGEFKLEGSSVLSGQSLTAKLSNALVGQVVEREVAGLASALDVENNMVFETYYFVPAEPEDDPIA